MIDLHIHTTASSDGQSTPEEIFSMARTLGLKAIAFADHNTTGNVKKGLELADSTGIELLPSIELNSSYNHTDLHLLAYGIDSDAEGFKAWIASIEKEKWKQSRARVKKLNELGFNLDWEDVIKASGGRIPTGISYLQALLSRAENKGDKRLEVFVSGERSDSPYLNFYLDYLRGGKPAYVPMPGTDSIEVISKIRSLGAVPVLAHPSDTPDSTVEHLADEGLMGLEVYSTYHDAESTEHFRQLAQSIGLLITAGSDYHGEGTKPGVKLGGIPCKDFGLYEKLKEAVSGMAVE